MSTESKLTALVSRPEGGSLPTVDEISANVRLVHDVMKRLMKKGTHWDVIPGCKKPSLLKPGAELLAMTFGISIECVVEREVLTDTDAEYRVRAIGRNRAGAVLGMQSGEASTFEPKYRWRDPVHIKEYEAYPDHLRRITWSKRGDEVRQVRQDAGGLRNTLLQMAAKRGSNQLIRSITGATEIFVGEPTDDKGDVEGRVAGEGDLRVVGIRDKTGSNEKGEWRLYFIRFSNDKEAATFNEDHAKLAERAMGQNLAVKVAMSEGKKPGDFKLDVFELVAA